MTALSGTVLVCTKCRQDVFVSDSGVLRCGRCNIDFPTAPAMTTPPSLSALVPEQRMASEPLCDAAIEMARLLRVPKEAAAILLATGFNECRQRVLEAVRSVPMEAYLQGDFDAPESAPRPDVSLGELVAACKRLLAYADELNANARADGYGGGNTFAKQIERELREPVACCESALRAQSPAAEGVDKKGAWVNHAIKLLRRMDDNPYSEELSHTLHLLATHVKDAP